MLDMLDSHAHITHFAQEAERGRIACKLHDSAVQSLTALIADLEYFRTRHLPLNAETREEVGAMYEKWQGLAQESLGLVSAIRAVYNVKRDPFPGAANRGVQLLDNRQKADKVQCMNG